MRQVELETGAKVWAFWTKSVFPDRSEKRGELLEQEWGGSACQSQDHTVKRILTGIGLQEDERQVLALADNVLTNSLTIFL